MKHLYSYLFRDVWLISIHPSAQTLVFVRREKNKQTPFSTIVGVPLFPPVVQKRRSWDISRDANAFDATTRTNGR